MCLRERKRDFCSSNSARVCLSAPVCLSAVVVNSASCLRVPRLSSAHTLTHSLTHTHRHTQTHTHTPSSCSPEPLSLSERPIPSHAPSLPPISPQQRLQGLALGMMQAARAHCLT